MQIYDEIDVKNAHRAGYWTGSIATFVGTLVLLIIVGLYVNS